jgi:transglutaminase-like putative cysteine protease
MTLTIHSRLEYRVAEPTDILLQIEAAQLPEQYVERAHIDLSLNSHFARVAAQDGVGERIWLRVDGDFHADYRATVRIDRIVEPIETLPAVPLHQLPGETVQYLLESRYCPSNQFHSFVEGEFAGLEGGAMVAALRDFVHDRFRYVPGTSNAETTALETFVRREGVCRDYAHVLIALTRAASIPARIASVYAPGVDPPDFHAVAEVFLGGEWHLVDATGMAEEARMAKIGIGRDAADISFLSVFGVAEMLAQVVEVTEG